MFVSGVIATITLVGTLVGLLVAGWALVAVDKYFNKHREH
jgi:hypothetical protein